MGVLELVGLIATTLAHSPAQPYVLKAAHDIDWPYVPNTKISFFTLEYDLNNITYEGYVAYPDSAKEHLHPGVLVAHQFMGLGEMEQFRARQMAAYGYVAFALDTYGKDNRPANSTEAIAMLTRLRNNVSDYHQRMLKGVEILKTLHIYGGPMINTSALVANGYCAGGQLVLELGRLGVDGLVAVAGFHSSLEALTDDYNGTNFTANVQAHHAMGDGDASLLAFEQEMRDRTVLHWSTVKYGNVMHGWTDPSSAVYAQSEAYNSHATMLRTYDDVLQHPEPPISCDSPSGGGGGPTDSGGSDAGKITGAVFGGLIGGLVIAGGGMFCMRRRSGASYDEF